MEILGCLCRKHLQHRGIVRAGKIGTYNDGLEGRHGARYLGCVLDVSIVVGELRSLMKCPGRPVWAWRLEN